MEIDYETFFSRSTQDKIVLLEDWIQKCGDLNFNSERSLKGFFRKIIEYETNIYIRKLSIEFLSFLSAIEKIRKSSTIDILLDIEDSDSPQIIVVSLKYLYFFYDDDNEILKKFQDFKELEDGDVSSEAYFRLGLIHLINNNEFSDKISFLKCLESSANFFKAAYLSVENRVDAEYFYEVTNYLISILSEDKTSAESTLKKLINLSFIRSAFSYSNESLKLENKILDVLLNVYRIFENSNNHKNWIDYAKEFGKLSQYHMELLNTSLSSDKIQNQLIESFKKSINSQILENIYINNFAYYTVKINNIQNQYAEDEILSSFLNIVKSSISSNNEKKNEDTQYLSICLQIKEILPYVDTDDLVQKLKDIKDVKDIKDILSLIKSYTEQKYERNMDVYTGDITGQEIYLNMLSSIKQAIPNYSEQKLNTFMRILEETIRYLMLTVKSKRSDDFNYLYIEKHNGKGDKASERDFQDSLYKHFLYSKIAYASEEEINNFADGGRIDIVFKLNNLTFPIELKKTKNPISKVSIREKYLEQLHTYIYSYDQLGIFAVLDLNEKTAPVNDVRELVYLDNIKPLYKVENKYPDFIVVVIIPGNKPLPSDKSTYT
ncbi:hypothetical protein ACIP9G_21740 [Lysinibacillus sp. NPDC093197]|uniref:hypothetical protein n=1 Tax=Lysinibacillus sp. NPDC093197 TaxID=3364132 RepID=UPI0037F6199B